MAIAEFERLEYYSPLFRECFEYYGFVELVYIINLGTYKSLRWLDSFGILGIECLGGRDGFDVVVYIVYIVSWSERSSADCTWSRSLLSNVCFWFCSRRWPKD